MQEIISGLFGMALALISVIFQLAGPVIILIIVAGVITKLSQPLIRNFIDYVSGTNPKIEKREIERIKHENDNRHH